MDIFWWLIGGFVVGLIAGWFLFGRRTAGADAGADAERFRSERDTITAERDRLARELEACTAARKALENQAPRAGLAAQTAASPVVHDDLRKIIGIGKENEARLKAAGVTTFAQIASWTEEDVKRIEKILAFDGRIAREKWIEQAGLLEAGNLEEFARRFPSAGNKTNT